MVSEKFYPHQGVNTLVDVSCPKVTIHELKHCWQNCSHKSLILALRFYHVLEIKRICLHVDFIPREGHVRSSYLLAMV